MDKYKQILSAYDIKSEKNYLSTSKKEKKARDGYFCIYECSNQLCTSTLKRAHAVKEMNISQIK